MLSTVIPSLFTLVRSKLQDAFIESIQYLLFIYLFYLFIFYFFFFVSQIHKRSAVIRYMFFNREDIVWYKPIELRTKYGKKGRIKEPLGEASVVFRFGDKKKHVEKKNRTFFFFQEKLGI